MSRDEDSPGADDFVKNYPFVPYQFQLVQKIFEAIRKAGATGLHLSRGERSMLDAFQSAAQGPSRTSEIGVLVPLYDFYPSIESFLDTAVKKTIDQAEATPAWSRSTSDMLHALPDPLRRRRQTNVDNLVTLCIDQVDGDRIALKQKITAALQRLERENLVSRSGDLYYFLTNEEREVSREIKGVDLTSAEETTLFCGTSSLTICSRARASTAMPRTTGIMPSIEFVTVS